VIVCRRWIIVKLQYFIMCDNNNVCAQQLILPTQEKLRKRFAELIKFLDDRSLALVMRDAVDDGRRALEILSEHYAGRGKPRIVLLYT